MENMKPLPKSSLWVALLMPSLTFAASGSSAVPPIHATASLLGSWSLDTSRLPMPDEARPKSVRITFDNASGGMLNVHVDIVYAPGKEVHSFSMAPLDGTLAAVRNSPEGDAMALKQPVPGVLVMALRKGNVLVSTRIYSVQPDGHGLVETVVYPADAGLLVMKTKLLHSKSLALHRLPGLPHRLCSTSGQTSRKLWP